MNMQYSARRRALKYACLAFSTLTAISATPTFAQERAAATAAAAAFDFDIPAQPLAPALTAFSAVTDLQVLYAQDGAGQARSPGARGRLTADQALAQLTAGTGFTFRYLRPGVVTLEKAAPAGERVLGPVRVEGAEGTSYAGPPTRGEGVAQLGGVRGHQDDEAIGYRPVVASIGAGSPVALEDIPRSISVITQEQIQKQDITTMGEALKRLPGVTFIESLSPSSPAQIVSRGFAIQNVQIDGGAPRSLSGTMLRNGMMDLSAYESIELVRGANGAFLGDGSPGGMLNLVRKRPGAVASTSITANLASWGRRELELDYSTPSLAGSRIAFRTTLAYREQGFFYDNVDRASSLLYAMFDAPLGDRARIETGFRYNKINDNGSYQGFPRYLDGPLIDLPRNFNVIPKWAYNDAENKEWFARFYVRLLGDWNFSFGSTYTASDQKIMDVNVAHSLYSATKGPLPGQSGGVIAARERGQFDESTFGIDFRLTGKFDTLFLKHNVQVLGDLNENTGGDSQDRRATNLSTYPIASVQDLDPSRYPLPILETFSPYTNFNSSNSSVGFTFTDNISWRNILNLNFNLRRYDSESSGIQVQNDRVTGATTIITPDETINSSVPPKAGWRPSLSLSLKPWKGLSVYGGRSEGSNDQSSQFTPDGKSLAPSLYKNFDLGVKYGRELWLLSFSVYDSVRTNVGVAIPNSQGQCPPTATSSCYFAGGATIKSKGVDVELNGQVFRGLSVIASYNFDKSRTVSNDLPPFTRAPSHMAGLFLDWTPWFNDRLSIDVGANYRSRVYERGTQRVVESLVPLKTVNVPYEFSQAAYVAFNLGANYRVSDSLNLRLYVENLTDKKYSSTVSTNFDSLAPPRSVLLKLVWNDRSRFTRGALGPRTLAPFGDPADWYGGFDVGYHSLGDMRAVSQGKKADGAPADWTYETTGGPLFTAMLGYRVSAHWRAELEGAFRRSDFGEISGEGAAPTGVCGARSASYGVPFTCDDAQGDADDWALMASAIHDFGSPAWRIRPFAGAGLGLSRSSIDFGGKLKGVGSDDILTYCTTYTQGKCSAASVPGAAWIGGDKQFFSLAYQGQAGVTVRFSDRASVAVTYRYFAAPKVKWTSWNGRLPRDPASFPTTPRLGAFKANYQDRALTVGVRWAFGVR